MLPIKTAVLLALTPVLLQTSTCEETPEPAGVEVGDIAVMVEACTYCHDSSGIATVVDENTLRIDEFTYDGAAPDAYIYLSTEGAPLTETGIPLSAMLTRAYEGETVTFDLPEGVTLADFDSITVYCVRFDEVFASGVFGE